MISKIQFLKKHSIIALGYFLLIAFLGVLLRFFSIVDFSINYRFIVHTHSHIALLGWVYTALTTLIYKIYLNESSISIKYKRLFWCTQITIIGMLFTFPFTGYAFFSIIFSTLFLITSYLFVNLVFKYTPKKYKQLNSYQLIRVSLWYMVISSIGPWALGIIMKTAGNTSDLYRNAIYFYLHFQYNGWFIIALFGVFFYVLEKNKIIISKKVFKKFFWLINVGVVLTFGISLLWMKPNKLIFILSILGSLFQIFAYFFLLNGLKPHNLKIKPIFSQFSFQLLRIVSVLFLIKLGFQLLGSTPYFANLISYNVDFIIGYLHWIFLGVISISLLLFLNQSKLIILSKKNIIIFLIGFFLTEVFIFYKGVVVWLKISLLNNYFIYLVVASSILLIGILSIFIHQFLQKKDN